MSNIMDDIEFELSRNNDLTLDLEDIPTSTHEVLLACKEEIERLNSIIANRATSAEVLFLNLDHDDSGDALSVAIATYYDTHPDKPDNDPIDDETGWGQWVMEQSREFDKKLDSLLGSQDND